MSSWYAEKLPPMGQIHHIPQDLPGRVSRRGLAPFLLGVLLWVLWGFPAPAALAQESGDSTTSLRLGYLAQRVMFDVGYGAHLERRFGARYVDLRGVALSVVFQRGGRIAYGLEIDALQGGFDYTTLNGGSGSAEFYLQQHVVKAHWFPLERWEAALGAGHGWLVRSVEGFQNAEITAANLGGNGGVAEGRTHGAVFFGEVFYRLFGSRYSAEVGLRYGYAPHFIPRDDPRPALDDAQRPVESVFNVGGLAYLLTATIRFGGPALGTAPPVDPSSGGNPSGGGEQP